MRDTSTSAYLNIAPNGSRRELSGIRGVVPVRNRRSVEARYDAAQNTDEFRNYWSASDSLDADSANSKAVRSTLVKRARYEVGNNGYADGMVQTHANYLVGIGPQLRMLAGNQGFNQAVEYVWRRWAKAVTLRRKLWCMAHAKVQDGEAIGIIRVNEGIRAKVPLDLVLVETEQCQTPRLMSSVAGYVDGIRFDEYGNPLWYDVLKYHPGGSMWMPLADPEQVPAKFVMHWWQLRRPGSHRGVPEFRSTLNVGASSRRWREATVASAETAADFSVLLKTQASPDDGPDAAAPFSSIELQKRMMTALPMGWDAGQMKSEHPNAQYQEFLRTQINEMARPKSIPYNLAACDSSSYNYASGRLDHQTYFTALNIEREDCNDLVLDVLFARWWEMAVAVYGWSADPLDPPDHLWDWPQHPVADIKNEAQSIDTRLRNGSICPSEVASQSGADFEDRIAIMATDYGVSVEEMRAILLKATFTQAMQADPVADPDNDPADDVAKGKR